MGERVLGLSGVFADVQGNGDANAENVNDHADEHGLYREGVFCGSGQGNYNPIHEEVDRDSVQDAGQDGMINQEADEPAGQEEDSGCAECNNEVK